jgi:type IV pilus assembly protein PilB
MSTEMRPVMGELLLKEGLLTPEQLQEALAAQRRQGGRLGYHLIRLGFLNVQRLSQFLRDSMGLIPYDLAQWIKDPSVTEAIPSNLAQFYQVVPVERNGNTLTVALADLDNPSIVPALEELTGLTVDPVVCPREVVVRALEQFYGVAKDPGVERSFSGDHLFVLSSSARRIRPLHWSTLKPDSSANDWLRTILAEAIRSGCRAVSIRPGETTLRVAFKHGERWEDRFGISPRKSQELDALLTELARLKDRSRGSRLEGRVRLQVDSRFLSLYVRALTSLQGTRYTLMLYDERVFLQDWERYASQLLPGERESLAKALGGGSGLLLLVGSPGHGMSQVYYALLSWLARSRQPAIALEEYALLAMAEVSQMEVSRQEGATWPELIALSLKQSPALFACYPIKERSSMELAFLAASRTCVLGVLHQPDALSAIRWFMRNQFRSPLRAGVLKGILTVASLPELCPNCRLPMEVPGRTGEHYALFTRQGCERCLAWEQLPTQEILEWLPLGSRHSDLFQEEPDAALLQRSLLGAGGVPLGQRVLKKAKDGVLDGHEARDFLP